MPLLVVPQLLPEALRNNKGGFQQKRHTAAAGEGVCLGGVGCSANMRSCGNELFAARLCGQRMSDYGYERTYGWAVIYVRFTPESRHREPSFGMSANRLLADVVACTANDEAKAIWTTANPVTEWRMGNKKLK